MINCQQLLRELSNYLDGEVEPSLRDEIRQHLATCRRCSVLVDSTRKAVRIIADERVFTLPFGFSGRLEAFLANHIEPPGNRQPAGG